MVGVLGCAEGCAWCCPQPPSCSLFFLCSLFLSPKTLFLPPATAAAPGAVSASSHSLALLATLPLSDGKCHCGGFGAQHPVPGACWPLSGSEPSPQPPLCPGVGPEAIPLSPTGVVRLHLPCLTPLWGQGDLVLGMAQHRAGTVCHHPRGRLPLPWGQQGHTPGMAWHVQAGHAAPGDGVTPPGHAPLRESAGESREALPGGAGDTPGAGTVCGARGANGHLDSTVLGAHSGRWDERRSRVPHPESPRQLPQGAPPARGCRRCPGCPGCPGCRVWGGGCPSARPWRCVCRAGRKVLPRPGGGSRLICQMIIIAF